MTDSKSITSHAKVITTTTPSVPSSTAFSFGTFPPSSSSSSSGALGVPTTTSTSSKTGGKVKSKGKDPIFSIPHGFSHEQATHLEDLIRQNGYDFYNAEQHAIGPIKSIFHLILPEGFDTKRIATAPEDVGAGEVVDALTIEDLAAIYVLNRNACPDKEHAIKYGIIRLEMVKAGWYANQNEVIFRATPTDAMAAFRDDLKAIHDIMDKARTIAYVQPIFAELVFRTTGHHYLSTGDAGAEYKRKYNKLYDACLIGDCKDFLPNDYQFYNINHWVGPARAYEVIRSLKTSSRLPDAVKTRADAAPAGSALITTTQAALNVVTLFNIRQAILECTGIDARIIDEHAARIKHDPAKYHKTYRAYGKAPLTPEETAQHEHALAIAAQIAPITRAIIDVFAAKSALAAAVVLNKHVEQSPMLHTRAVKFFRALSRSVPSNFSEVFTDLKKPDIRILTTTTVPLSGSPPSSITRTTTV